MAIDSSLAFPAYERTRTGAFAEASFACFLLLVFVGLKPFALRDTSLLPSGSSGTGVGDVWRQLSYLACFSAIAVGAWSRNGPRMFSAVPTPLAVLLAWCVASALWASAPDVVLRRAGLELVIVFSAMLGVQTIGPALACAIFRALLTAILVVNFVSIVLVHQAVHLPGESDPQLVGNWRGLYYHKNITGAVCSITAILFFFQAVENKRARDWLIFVGAVIFTVMTHSKTSLALLPAAIIAGLLFRITRKGTVERWLVLTGGALVLTLALLALTVDYGPIQRFLTNPTELTGRVAIWQGEIAFMRDHALLGAGFGSFADTGSLSPLYNYVADKWVQGEAHGHNAYLQLLVTTGGVGFILAMTAFVVQPLSAFRRIERPDQVAFFAPLFATFVFILLHNFAESDLLEGDGPAWVAFLIMLGCLQARSVSEERRILLEAHTPEWSVP